VSFHCPEIIAKVLNATWLNPGKYPFSLICQLSYVLDFCNIQLLKAQTELMKQTAAAQAARLHELKKMKEAITPVMRNKKRSRLSIQQFLLKNQISFLQIKYCNDKVQNSS
jgi:hypothetical protein